MGKKAKKATKLMNRYRGVNLSELYPKYRTYFSESAFYQEMDSAWKHWIKLPLICVKHTFYTIGPNNIWHKCDPLDVIKQHFIKKYGKSSYFNKKLDLWNCSICDYTCNDQNTKAACTSGDEHDFKLLFEKYAHSDSLTITDFWIMITLNVDFSCTMRDKIGYERWIKKNNTQNFIPLKNGKLNNEGIHPFEMKDYIMYTLPITITDTTINKYPRHFFLGIFKERYVHFLRILQHGLGLCERIRIKRLWVVMHLSNYIEQRPSTLIKILKCIFGRRMTTGKQYDDTILKIITTNMEKKYRTYRSKYCIIFVGERPVLTNNSELISIRLPDPDDMISSEIANLARFLVLELFGYE